MLAPSTSGEMLVVRCFVVLAFVHPPSDVEHSQHPTVSHRNGRLLSVTLAKYRDYLGCSGR